MPRKVINGVVSVKNRPQKQKRRQRKQRRRGRKKKQKQLVNPDDLFADPLVGRSRVPAAYSYRTRSGARTRSARNNTSLTISGYDLVYRLTGDEQLIDGAFVAIPANPAYWTGTRIGQVATAYSQYRPLYLRFDYFPAVGTGTNGVITSGTFWNQGVEERSLTQALVTSNGGVSHPAYVRQRTNVRLKSNLEQNLFEMDGRLNSDTNPFIFLATTTGVNGIVPGYYMAHYTYELKNPIGDGNEYDVKVTTAGELTVDDIWENTSAVVMSDTNVGMGPGTVLAIELITTISVKMIQFFLKGSQAGVLADTVIKIFRNRNRIRTREENSPSSFEHQYCTMIEMLYGPDNNKNYYIIPPQGDDTVEPINVSSWQFSTMRGLDPNVARAGFLFKVTGIPDGDLSLDLYWGDVTKEMVAQDSQWFFLHTNGWSPIDGTKIIVDSIHALGAGPNATQVQPGIRLHLKQLGPDNQNATASDIYDDFDPNTTLVHLAHYPAWLWAPLTQEPTVQRAIGRGPVTGRVRRLRVNRPLRYPKIPQATMIANKLAALRIEPTNAVVEEIEPERSSEESVDENELIEREIVVPRPANNGRGNSNLPLKSRVSSRN